MNATPHASLNRVPTPMGTIPAGPDQSVARAIVQGFEPVAYIYAGLSTWTEEEWELRWRRLAKRLRTDGAPEPAVGTLDDRVAAAQPAPATLAAFAAADGSLVHEERIADVGLPGRAGYVAPAPVIPLLTWMQDRPPYLLVVTDRAGGDLTACAGGGQPPRTWTVTGPDDEIERNAPGGWSQPRYQRRAEDSWRHNAERVAEEAVTAIAHVGAQVLVLSGDVRAVQLLTERLPSEPGLLIGHITGSRALDGSQAGRTTQVEQALRAAANAQTASLLEQFRSHLEPGGLAVEGYAATIAALGVGRIATLLISDSTDDSRTAWFGAGATEIYLDHDSAKLSDAPIRAGRLADVAVRAALMSGARVRVVAAGTPGEPIEGIGALCR
jgi:hypothetical protein